MDPFTSGMGNPFAPSQPQGGNNYPGSQVPPNPSEQVPGTPSTQAPAQPNPNSEQGSQSAESSPKSIVDVMGEVWETEVKDEGELDTLTDDHLKTASDNFKPNIDTEALTTAMENNDASALAELIANATRDAYSQALGTSSKVSENYLAQDRENLQSRIRTETRRDDITNTLGSLNPAFQKSGPMKDMAGQLTTKYMTKFPNATSKEAAEAINDYVKSQFGMTETKSEKETKDTGDDWTKF